MFEKLKSVFTGSEAAKSSGVAGDSARRIQIATAVILLEVANSDEKFSDSEKDSIVHILKNHFDLSNEEVQELIEVSEEERKGSVDMWLFANIINENYSEQEKHRVMENIWKVIYADGRLDKYEDHIVHKLATILHISHEKMIEAKLKYLPKE
jgi:uncharacterized tellurite resistance protein B-like protein